MVFSFSNRGAVVSTDYLLCGFFAGLLGPVW